MRRKSRLVMAAIVCFGLLLLAGCGDSSSDSESASAGGKFAAGKADKKRAGGVKRLPGQPQPYFGELPSLAAINIRDVVLQKITDELDYPWAMEFVSADEVLVNEFGGRLVRVSLPDGELEYISGMPDIPSGKGQVGLMDLALHPDFASNQLLYFSHAVARQEGDKTLYATAVSRARLSGSELHDVQQIFITHPFVGQTSNFGGALEFDENNYLYIGTGDRGRRHRSQQTENLNGMIVRLDDAGNVPPDNPFLDNPDVDDRIYAIGVRNPQGLVRDPKTGTLYETEHGPMGGDEVNIIQPGRNYGWPTITYGMNYNTQRVGLGTARDGLEQPLYYYLPSMATSPITIYRGTMFPEWEGDLFVGLLKGSHVTRLDLVSGRVVSVQSILKEIKNRIRDVKVAADGSLYTLAQDGRLLRLFRVEGREDLEYPEDRKGNEVYRTICSSCHSSGQVGVPQMTDPQAWKDRISQGKEVLYRHTIDGYGGMPPLGLCETCSEAEIRLTVDLMVKIAKQGLKLQKQADEG